MSPKARHILFSCGNSDYSTYGRVCMTIVVSLLTEKKTKLRVIDDIKLVYGCKRNDCAVQLCNCKKSNPILLVVHE